MSETEDRLYGLMEIAERQQAAVQAALDGLAAERAALKWEREALAHGVRDLQLGTQGAVRSAVTDSLAGAATEGMAAVQAATKPLLGRLAGMTAEAGQAEAALRQVVLWASWRLLGWVMAGVAGLVLLGWLASTLVLWWDMGTIAAAQLQKAQLQQEVAGLQATQEAWVKAGMLGRLERCGPKARPCIRVYNQRGTPEGTWLDFLHRALDEAVAAAYGWPPDLSDSDVLVRLLALNRVRTERVTEMSISP